MSAKSAKLLTEYNKKRDFKKTREPKGAHSTKKTNALSFVVQKHAATRLHWDLRLEMDGVFKSWAVTNEPVSDPTTKRLAVKVEDHPLSYGSFEGDIPKGQYGGGHVDIWDKGTWEAVDDAKKGLKAGKLSFRLKGKRLKGRWTLVRMRTEGKRENWLLIKSDDGEIANKVKTRKPPTMPDAVLKAPRKKSTVSYKPELALRVDTPPQGNDWIHEIKYDGYRALVLINKGNVTIVTRNGLDWTDRFSSIAKAALEIKAKSAELDGEIVVFKPNGKTDFSALQKTLSGDAKHPMTFIAFDLLSLDGKDLKKKKLIERKKMLKTVIGKNTIKSVIQYSDYIVGGGDKVFAEAKKHGLEGIISKAAKSLYTAGRNNNWLKIKHIQIEEFIIGGIIRRTDNNDRIGAVLLGQFEGKKLVYKGKSGTGFPEALSDDLLKKIKPLRLGKSPFTGGTAPKDTEVEWVKPKLVCMIDYTEMTSDGHVRHGVFKGLREDKVAPDVKSEKVQTIDGGDPIIGGVKITHPDRVVYPENGYIKSDVARYYDRVADLMLPYLKNRPVSVIRCPDGLVKKCFFQRHVSGKAAEEVTQLKVKDTESGEPYFSIDTKEALMSMVQFGAIEFHVWGSQAQNVEKPDRLVFDLDPDPKIDFKSIKAAAKLVRDRLKDIGLKSFVKTTGGKGLHVVVPIKPDLDWDDIKHFTHQFVLDLENDYPQAFVTTSSKTERRGRIYLDYLRNDRTSTSVAPFSLRAKPDATISVPLKWDDLKFLKAANYYSFKNIARLLKGKYKDPWKEMDKTKQSVSKKSFNEIQGKAK